MPKPSARKFALSDALTLVVVTAIPMAATRHNWAGYYDSFGPWGEAYHIHFIEFMYRFRHLLYSVSYFAATWSLACLMLGLRRPRPAFLLVVRQPGMTACMAAVVVLIIQLANLTLALGVRFLWWTDSRESISTNMAGWLDRLDELPLIPSMIGCAITATWVIQATSGRWRPATQWTDRWGRALGFFWIATIPFSWFSWNL
jgi:hypothetical protein